MSAYTDNLRHIAEPQAPSEREKAVSTTIEDHEALWVADILREFAHYADHDHDDQSGIAVGYASFIDKQVRDHGKSYVTLYAHTDVAAETLMDALYWDCPDDVDDRGNYPMVVFRSLEESFAEVFAHFVDDEMAPESPPEPQVTDIDGEETVVFDEDEARNSYAMMEMEKAESEHLAELEAEAEKRGINNQKTPRVNPNYRE
jgi:hypothetical protein